MGNDLQWLTSAAIGVIVLVVVIGMAINISAEQKDDESCTSTYTFSESLTYPSQCCLKTVFSTWGLAKCKGANITTITDAGSVYHEGIAAESKFSGKFGLIVTIVVLVFIIGLLAMLWVKRNDS